MSIVIDTPVMEDLIKDFGKFKCIVDYLNMKVISIYIPYTLERQYKNVVNIKCVDLSREIRNIGYRVSIVRIPKSKEDSIKKRYSSLLENVENAISSKRHSGSDDAVIITCAVVQAKNHSKKFIVIAKQYHVEHYRNAKHVIERELKTRTCWFNVIDINDIIQY